MRKNTIAILAALAMISLATLACAFASDLLAGQPSGPEENPRPESQESVPPADTQPVAPEQPAEQESPTPESESPPETLPTEAVEPEAGGPVQSCDGDVCVYDNAFALQRPIGGQGRATIDPTLRFGTYLRTLKNAYHGVSFINSTGTPVLAAADGTVVYAGDDSQTAQSLYKNYYGSLVVLEHNLPVVDAPVYTLYAHLSEVQVARGDPVSAGQQIGLVGNSGDISGSALHFEVRVGENQYAAAQNPELWLQPLPDEGGDPTGALGGRVLDAAGSDVAIDNIVLERLTGPGLPAQDTFYLKTYAEDRLKGDAPFQESFAMAGLPAGDYQISFYYGPDLIQREAAVEAGRLTVVTIQLP